MAAPTAIESTAPRFVRRFSRTERVLHWTHASAFFVMLATGLILYVPKLTEQVGRRGLVKDITSALVKNYGVPADAVVVTVVETAKHDKAKGGVLFSEMSVPPQAKAS